MVRIGSLKEEWPDGLKKFITDAHALGFNRNLRELDENDHDASIWEEILVGMKPKKVSETAHLSKLIHQMASENQATHILDLGCGRGYLTTVLAFQFNYHVIGWDQDINQTIGASQRANRIQNLLKHRGKQVTGSLDFITERIDISCDLSEIFGTLFKYFPHLEPGSRWLLVGLHCCGNLSSTMISSFCSSTDPHPVALVNVGCCYHLLKERDCIDWSSEKHSFDHDINPERIPTLCNGFPMSLQLSDVGLGLSMRMMACQAPKKWGIDSPVNGDNCIRKLYYRAVLDLLIKEHGIRVPTTTTDEALMAVDSGERTIRTLETKDPIIYTRNALKKLGCSSYMHKLSDGVILATFQWHSDAKNQIALVWALRCMLGDIVETLILLDRLLFMKEMGAHSVGAVAISNPSISPRNMALICSKP